MIKITVDGTPAPQGSKTRNRYGAIYEDNRAVGPWREAVRAETQRAMLALGGKVQVTLIGPDLGAIRDAAAEPMAGPVAVVITFRLRRPKGHYGSGRNAATVRPGAPAYPVGKPDVDKLARAVLDGLTAGGAFKDDAQVITLAAGKVYAERAGADIQVSEVTE
jgi:crossover junction endodeoxyribonuclease RusA